MSPFLGPFDPRLTDEQKDKVEALTRERFGAIQAETRRRQVDSLSRAIEKHGLGKMRELADRIPGALGSDDNSPQPDQLEKSLTLPHDLAEEYREKYLPPKLQALCIAADGLRGLGRLRGFAKLRTIRQIADEAFDAHNRPDAFGDSTRDPNTQLFVGGIVEPTWPPPSPTAPDTRVYALAPRWPFEKVPVATLAELRSFANDLRSQRFCDLRLRGGFCDGASWSHSEVLPIVRSDVIVCITLCADCLKKYRKDQGIKSGEIVDPAEILD